MELIDANGYEPKWVQDTNGYFLIRLNKKTKEIEVGYCKKNPEPTIMIHGKTAEEIMYKIIEKKLVTTLNHAAYLGKELKTAQKCLENNKEYVQK